ncbi:MAG TPA: sigma-70 family RNA polymerase sigma factor, partial [Chitinophagaceae bacterium]|nr:sigma-70 family RNA polymerase sigma factor [Chitinophagaceae bacterium]
MNHTQGDKLADKELVRMVLNGQTAAFAHIIKNTERLVAQIVFKLISDPEDRKDLAQDIYIKVFHKLGSFQFQSKLSTWIAQVSYNTCLDHLRRKKINMEELREGKEEDRRFSSQYIQEGSISSTDENLLRKDRMA